MENCSEARKMIFDFGGHVGQDTDYYLKLGFRVVTVEPNPELAARLRNRFREQIASGALSVVEAAIAEKPGTGSFFKFEKSVFGTISPDWTARNTQMGAKFEEIQVEYMTVAQLFDQFGCPYYMKLDIEGADIICVEALRHLPKPSFLSVEVEKHDFAKFSSDVTLIHDLGYEVFPARSTRNRSIQQNSSSSTRRTAGEPPVPVRRIWNVRTRPCRGPLDFI